MGRGLRVMRVLLATRTAQDQGVKSASGLHYRMRPAGETLGNCLKLVGICDAGCQAREVRCTWGPWHWMGFHCLNREDD
ncbi:hypothetical protein MHYP_G00072220 [Metynnis hypsauchen]